MECTNEMCPSILFKVLALSDFKGLHTEEDSQRGWIAVCPECDSRAKLTSQEEEDIQIGFKTLSDPKTAPPDERCPYCNEKIRQDAGICRYCGRNLPVGARLADEDIFELEDEVRTEIPIDGRELETLEGKWTIEVNRAWKIAEDTCRRFRLRLVGPTSYRLTLIIPGEAWADQGRDVNWVLQRLCEYLQQPLISDDRTLELQG